MNVTRRWALGGIGAAGIGAAVGIFTSYYLETRKHPSSMKTTLYLNWLYTGSFAGEVLATEIAPYSDLTLSLIEGGQGRDPLRLIRDGEFGIASADEILRAIDKGADYKIIGVVNDDHPAGFVSLKSSNITKPSDFIGRRVGMLPFGSTGLVYQALLKKTGVDRTDITEVPVSPDLRTFIDGRINDVQPVFVFDEPVTLDALKVEYNLIVPKAYGVRFKGPCYFTTTPTIKNQPDLVRSFSQIMSESWMQAAADPGRAIAALGRLGLHLNLPREQELLKRALPYYVSPERSVLHTDVSTWEEMVTLLIEAGILSKRPNLDLTINMSFLPR